MGAEHVGERVVSARISLRVEAARIPCGNQGAAVLHESPNGQDRRVGQRADARQDQRRASQTWLPSSVLRR